MHSSPLTDPIFRMDATNNNLYDGLSPNGMSPNGMSPHDAGFEFNAFDGEAFADAEHNFVEPLSGTASPVSSSTSSFLLTS